MSIFKACDVRGRYGSDLTPAVALRFGRAMGAEMAGQTLAVGGDVRPSSGPLKASLIEGLVASGCRVLDLGTLPTPAYYFAKDHFGCAGGVMVTGSHNPPGDNGFKVSLGPLPVTEEELGRLAARMAAGDFVDRPGGCVETVDAIPPYEDYVKEKLGDLGNPGEKRPRIVVDAGNGCYSHVAPRLLRELGYPVVDLFCEPDGMFPNRSPNPAVAANLAALCETVVDSGADLGVAYDGDGDRAVFVDERGHVVENDRSIVLFARYLLGQQGAGSRFAPEVIYDIKCSSAVAEGVRAAGGTPVMEKSGHVFIKTSLLRRHAVFGGEISGHFFFGELGGDDGLYATLLMLRIVAEDGRGLAAMAASVPRYPITPDLRLPCPPAHAAAIVEQLAEIFGREPGPSAARSAGWTGCASPGPMAGRWPVPPSPSRC